MKKNNKKPPELKKEIDKNKIPESRIMSTTHTHTHTHTKEDSISRL